MGKGKSEYYDDEGYEYDGSNSVLNDYVESSKSYQYDGYEYGESYEGGGSYGAPYNEGGSYGGGSYGGSYGGTGSYGGGGSYGGAGSYGGGGSYGGAGSYSGGGSYGGQQSEGYTQGGDKDYYKEGDYDYNADQANLNYIFDPKAKYNANESDYDYTPNLANGQQFRNVKSSRIPLDPKMKKAKSKTLCKIPKAKVFFDKRQKNHKLILGEHKALQNIGNQHPVTCGSHSLNDLKNRYSSAVPFDYNRVKLLDILFESESDYINASYINSFDRRCAFIACQNPLEHTVKDFWGMAYENRCKAIFALVNYENKKTPMERYWPPEGTVLEYEEFEVHALKKSKLGKIIIRDFEIVPTNNMAALKVRHFNYSDWSDMRASPVMSEVNLLLKNAREFIANESAGPIIIHCTSGTGRTGVFIGLILLTDQIEQLNSFDVFRTCAFIKEQRRLTFKDLVN